MHSHSRQERARLAKICQSSKSVACAAHNLTLEAVVATDVLVAVAASHCFNTSLATCEYRMGCRSALIIGEVMRRRDWSSQQAAAIIDGGSINATRRATSIPSSERSDKACNEAAETAAAARITAKQQHARSPAMASAERDLDRWSRRSKTRCTCRSASMQQVHCSSVSRSRHGRLLARRQQHIEQPQVAASQSAPPAQQQVSRLVSTIAIAATVSTTHNRRASDRSRPATAHSQTSTPAASGARRKRKQSKAVANNESSLIHVNKTAFV
jgi:hypothetical protein